MDDQTPQPSDADDTIHWNLLREHAAWLNQEKQIIWRRYASSITAVSIYFAGSLLAYKEVSALAAFLFSIFGSFICIIWLLQTIYGWNLVDRRLEIVSEIQSKISEPTLAKWPLAFRHGIEQKHDWINFFAIITILVFLLSFLVLAGISGTTEFRALIQEFCVNRVS